MKELVWDGEGQMYKLKRDPESNHYYFVVLVGGIGQYVVEFRLTGEELTEYQNNGKDYLNSLAAWVRGKPEYYSARNKADPILQPR